MLRQRKSHEGTVIEERAINWTLSDVNDYSYNALNAVRAKLLAANERRDEPAGFQTRAK